MRCGGGCVRFPWYATHTTHISCQGRIYSGTEQAERGRKREDGMNTRKKRSGTERRRENNNKLFISHNSITDLISQIAVGAAAANKNEQPEYNSEWAEKEVPSRQRQLDDEPWKFVRRERERKSVNKFAVCTLDE